MELYLTIVNDLKPLSFVTNSTILDVVKILKHLKAKYLTKSVKKFNRSKLAGLKPETATQRCS